jgi:hypothetical protein
LEALPAPPFPLTTAEKQMFETILAMVKHLNLKTTVRAAGGWVRDKVWL